VVLADILATEFFNGIGRQETAARLLKQNSHCCFKIPQKCSPEN
jgi:hypothetical protein